MTKQLLLTGGEFVDRWRDTLQLCAGLCARRPRTKIFFATFLSEKPVPTLLGRLSREIDLARKADYWLASSPRRAQRRRWKLRFGVFRSGENAWTAFTLTETKENEDVLLRLLRSLSPDLSEASLTSNDIRTIFENMEKLERGAVSVNKVVAYSYMREGQISFFKDQAYDVVFNKAENEGRFLDKVDFLITPPNYLHGFVARNGVAKFMGGDIQLFTESVLKPMTSISTGKHEMFRTSSRKPGSTDVFVIDVQFGETVFQNRDDNFAFISSLDQMTRSGIAVLHENPYVHVSLIDFFDGSAFEIFATTKNTVTIVPQVGASPFSLNRLCNHIFENFREGAVVKPKKEAWTLEDVLA
jgi:hypothetical protein